MAETLVQTTRTTPTTYEYARAALQTVSGISKEATAVLWAHFAAETGRGQFCWNWNLGNVKHVKGDGHDYVSLKGVWEGVTPEQAARLIASGQWLPDPSPDHAIAVGPGKVSIIASTSNPATWFRAFPTLDVGMTAYVNFLSGNRWKKAWEAAIAGTVAQFSKQLGAAGYYTASEAVYTKKLTALHNEFMSTTHWEKAVALLKDAETSTGDQPIVHPRLFFSDPPDGEDVS